MDPIKLQTLRDEMREDCRVVAAAYQQAEARFERHDAIAYEACAFQVCRLYNAFEQMGLRIAKAFENNIDDEQGWHSALLNRLAIQIEGVRPALLTTEIKTPLRELKAFRHVFVHAYELDLDPEKLRLLLKYARQVAEILPVLAEKFVSVLEAGDQGDH
jgi:HepT-like protein